MWVYPPAQKKTEAAGNTGPAQISLRPRPEDNSRTAAHRLQPQLWYKD